MRIRHLVLTDSFAGTEQHVCVLANAQAAAGHEVQVWGGEPSAMVRRLDATVSHRPCLTVRDAWALASRSGQVDIQHAHMTKAETAALLSRRWSRGPVVSTRHFAAVRGSSAAGRLVRPVLLRGMAAQIAVSEFVAKHVDGPAQVIYAGVDRPIDRSAERDHVVLVAQRLSPEKRTRDAIEAFAASGLMHQGWRLDIAGRGHDAEALRARARQVGVGDGVRFLGFRDDLFELLGRAAVVLATAPAEPFGLTVVEAMARATAVVAAHGGGHRETVGRASPSYLYPVGDTTAAASALVDLASDEQIRRAYGQRLLEVQQEFFTPDRQYRETMAIYDAVVGR